MRQRNARMLLYDIAMRICLLARFIRIHANPIPSLAKVIYIRVNRIPSFAKFIYIYMNRIQS